MQTNEKIDPNEKYEIYDPWSMRKLADTDVAGFSIMVNMYSPTYASAFIGAVKNNGNPTCFKIISHDEKKVDYIVVMRKKYRYKIETLAHEYGHVMACQRHKDAHDEHLADIYGRDHLQWFLGCDRKEANKRMLSSLRSMERCMNAWALKNNVARDEIYNKKTGQTIWTERRIKFEKYIKDEK